MNLVFYLLLNLLHLFSNLYCFIVQYVVKICLFMQHHVYSCKAFQNYLTCETSGDNLASKLPKHIAILVGLEEITVADIAKLIDWCITTKIPYLTFYDHKGDLQKNLPFIKKKVEQLASSTSCDRVWYGLDNDAKDNIDNIINKSTVKNQNIRIQILSYQDGKKRIVSLAQQLSTTCLEENGDSNKKDVTCQLIGEKLNGDAGIPEPDLAIVFGKTMCSYGFLPWHTRITEFFVAPTQTGISVDDFTSILIKYSRCQQHFGK